MIQEIEKFKVEDLTEDQTVMLERMIECGVDQGNIPFVLGISKEFTLNQLCDRHPKLRLITDEMREKYLDKVEQCLYAIAIGTTTIETSTDKKGETIIKEKQIAPNFNAAAYILENRRSEKWRKRIEISKVNTETPIKDDSFGNDEVEKIRRVSRGLLAVCTGDTQGEYSIPNDSPQDLRREQGREDSADTPVSAETSDQLQDTFLDF